jgi:hypothetical protein
MKLYGLIIHIYAGKFLIVMLAIRFLTAFLLANLNSEIIDGHILNLQLSKFTY